MNKMKTLGLAALLAIGASTVSAAEVSGTIGYVSDYVFRGISQTDEDGALQGGLNLDFDSGFYLGVWGSEVDDGEEFDFSGGYKSTVGLGGTAIDFGIGVTQYVYTESDFSDDYTELNLFVGTQLGQRPNNRIGRIGNIGVAVDYSDDVFELYGEDVEYVHAKIYYESPVTRGFNIHASYGYSEYSIDTPNGYFSVDDSWDYEDWNVGINKRWTVDHGDIVFSADYYDTDIDNNVQIADDRFVAGIRFDF